MTPLAFFETAATRLNRYRWVPRLIAALGVAVMILVGRHTDNLMILGFLIAAWGVGLDLLCLLYQREESDGCSKVGRAPDIILGTLVFFTAMWYIILTIVTLSVAYQAVIQG